jgi:hypothetical protein
MKMTESQAHIGEFRLSITEALRTQMMAAINSLAWQDLSASSVSRIENRSGIYQLALDNQPVYIGKSDGALGKRLAQHLRKLSARYDRDALPGDNAKLVSRVAFRCVYVDEDLDAVAPEKILIDEFKKSGNAPWNHNGFGNNDPGRKRDGSAVKIGHFDMQFPIDLNVAVELPESAISSTRDLMEAFKAMAPFLFRFSGDAPMNHMGIESTRGCQSAFDWLELIAKTLPAGWVTVVLPGYVISYPNHAPTDYTSRLGAWVSHGGTATYEQHEPTFAH